MVAFYPQFKATSGGKKVRCATARSDATPKSPFKAISTAVAKVAGIDAVSSSCGCYTRNVVSATTPQAVIHEAGALIGKETWIARTESV